MMPISRAVSSSSCSMSAGISRQPGGSRRPPAALAGDQLVALGLVGRSNQDGLQHAVLGDRRGELGQRVLVERHPRLIGVGRDPVERNVADAGGLVALAAR